MLSITPYCCVKWTLLKHAEENTRIEVTFMTEISPFNTIVSISWLLHQPINRLSRHGKGKAGWRHFLLLFTTFISLIHSNLPHEVLSEPSPR